MAERSISVMIKHLLSVVLDEKQWILAAWSCISLVRIAHEATVASSVIMETRMIDNQFAVFLSTVLNQVESVQMGANKIRSAISAAAIDAR